MALIPLIDCYELLDLDPKTVRSSLKRAGIVVTPHPTDARIKCLTTEQTELLASLHSRLLRPQTPDQMAQPEGTSADLPHLVPASPDIPRAEGSDAQFPTLKPDPGLFQKLTSLETRVAQLSDHLAELALFLLRERDHTIDRRISTLENAMAELAEKPISRLVLPDPDRTLERDESVVKPKPARELRPVERLARSRMPPLIEYSAPGTYVVVSSQEGELSLVLDSAEWFDWLASLSSFRFVGQAGRFTACRESKGSRGWVAHRSVHQHRYKRYLGITDRLTIATLEHMAATLLPPAVAL